MTSPGKRYAQCDDTCTTDCGHCKGNGPPPAETQQDDDLRDREGGQYVHDALTHLAEQWVAAERHEEADLLLSLLAARPSADTETLRRVRAVVERLEAVRSNADDEGVRRGFDRASRTAARHLRAALDAR